MAYLLLSKARRDLDCIISEGCTLLLINATPYTWKRVACKSSRMGIWSFPRRVQPGTIASVYVEFKHTIDTIRHESSGLCVYKLQGTTEKERFVRVEAADDPPNLDIRLENVETSLPSDTDRVKIGFQHDGQVSFILSGKEGAFSCTRMPRDWMQSNLKTLGHRPLHKICMPGTHDAGMGEITHTGGVPKDIMAEFTQTQSFKILGQLDNGSRYFDIRPVLANGVHWTGHYGGKHGARGQKMSSIVDDINAFTAQCAELIILNLSHSLNTDDDWREYNQKDWNSLFKELLRLDHRYVAVGKDAKDLSLYSLSAFIGQGVAAVVIVVEAPEDISFGPYADKGFFAPAQFNVENEYANSNDTSYMVHDQLDKMQKHMSSDDKRLFLLSWTLTQQPLQITSETLEPPIILDSIEKLVMWKCQNKTIRALAYTANKALFNRLLPCTSVDAFPNVIYVDYLDSRNFAALAMAVNDKVFTNVETEDSAG